MTGSPFPVSVLYELHRAAPFLWIADAAVRYQSERR